MRRISSLAKGALAFAVLSLLGGCAGQVNMLPTLSTQTQLQPGQGIVVARVINASSYPLPFNHLTITPENLNESKQIKPERLVSPRPQMHSSTVFAAPAKAGRYALSSIRVFYSGGDRWYSRFAGTNARFGTFEVKPGHVTDLGTIIYYQKPQEDKYIDTLLRLPEPQLGEVLDKYFPFYRYDENKMLSWNADEYEEERQYQYVSVAQNPTNFNKRYLAPDKSIYFLGKLGVIVKRTAQGEWELDAVDTNLDLTTIAQNRRGDLIVGGTEGRLFWKPAGGGWQDISLDYHYQIEELLFSDEHTIDMLAKEETKLTVFRTDTSGKEISWQALNHYTSLYGWHSSAPVAQDIPHKNGSPVQPRLISSVVLSEVGDHTYITIRTRSQAQDPVFGSSDSKTFGYHAGDWHTYPPEQEPEVSSVIDAGAIKLGIKKAGFWSWDGRPTYLRYDENLNSWEEIITHIYKCNTGELTENNHCLVGQQITQSKRVSFNFRAIPWFKNALEAIAIVSFTDFNAWSGERSYETKIMLTRDGGKSWSDTGHSLPREYCSSVVPEISDRLLISCAGVTGDFYESFDHGASWQHVRQHENF